MQYHRGENVEMLITAVIGLLCAVLCVAASPRQRLAPESRLVMLIHKVNVLLPFLEATIAGQRSDVK